MGSRAWIRVWCDNWLTGTLKDEPIEIRGVWIGLLNLAGNSNHGDSGEVKLSNEIGLTDAQIAKCLSVSVPLWRRSKARFCETDRIKIGENGAISITNWQKYQSEYGRQKPYRGTKDTQSDAEIEAENRRRMAERDRHRLGDSHTSEGDEKL